MSSRAKLEAWVDECARLTQPDSIVWLDGSEQEYEGLIAEMLRDGSMRRLNAERYPNSYLYQSDPNDVARTEEVTFICTSRKEDAGPTNNWMSPEEAKATARPIFEGSMRGRVMYVIPYLMGPVGSPLGMVGVELTDSPYVAASMRIMTRMGAVALDRLDATGGEFVAGLHSIADLDPSRRYILHFPEENLIWSVGSGYGGNALLGKKCLSLRLASWMGRQQGWLAEHMLILGLEDPNGDVTYMAGAFPSACGKTNLAMLVSPLTDQGWKVWTVGDDICWMRIGEDGRLWAVNPEAGFFGVAPGTNAKTNPNAMATLSKNSIFTNVAVTPDGEPWWEDIDPEREDTTSRNHQLAGRGRGIRGTALPRIPTPASPLPPASAHLSRPVGMIHRACRSRPSSSVAVARASRRSSTSPSTGGMASSLARAWHLRRPPPQRARSASCDAIRWRCCPSAATTWATTGRTGSRWAKSSPIHPRSSMSTGSAKTANGKFLWPGYGQNVRVLMWMLERIRGGGKAVKTPVGYVPTADGLNLDGLTITPETMQALLAVHPADWQREWADQGTFFKRFGEHLPAAIAEEHAALGQRVSAAE